MPFIFVLPVLSSYMNYKLSLYGKKSSRLELPNAKYRFVRMRKYVEQIKRNKQKNVTSCI